jgi:hypothetical protein
MHGLTLEGEKKKKKKRTDSNKKRKMGTFSILSGMGFTLASLSPFSY